MTELIRMLPTHYRDSPQDAELQRVLSLLADRLRADRDMTLQQLHPSTASGWGLDLWEQAMGIPTDRTMAEERRRARVLAKVKGAGNTTVEQLVGIASAFSTGAVEIVEHFDQYRFEIWYTETIGPIQSPEDLAAIVNELKPAHLAWEVKYREKTRTQVRIGILPRQGDKIVWRVDCR